MEGAGYTVGGGKHTTFLAPGQKSPTRCNTLKGDYTESAIRERIEGKRIAGDAGTASVLKAEPTQPKLLIDIENSIKAKGSPGYERWAKVFNLKQVAATLAAYAARALTTDLCRAIILGFPVFFSMSAMLSRTQPVSKS